jgi:hypothetical protein
LTAPSRQDLLAGEERAPDQEQDDGVQPLYGALGRGSVEPGRPLDPDLLALLINDILVEQARRHGVDL